MHLLKWEEKNSFKANDKYPLTLYDNNLNSLKIKSVSISKVKVVGSQVEYKIAINSTINAINGGNTKICLLFYDALYPYYGDDSYLSYKCHSFYMPKGYYNKTLTFNAKLPNTAVFYGFN